MSFNTIIIYIISYLTLFISLVYIITFLKSKSKLKSEITKEFPFISVVIPAYNKEEVIVKTINSVINLDYPKDKLEIIVVDDGSTDKTYRIANQFENENLKVFTKENKGKSNTLNFGIKIAKGDLVLCLDADTFVEKDLLKKAIKHFSDPEVGAVLSTLKPFKNESFFEKIQIIEYNLASFIRKILSLIDSLPAAPACSIYRRNFFKKYGYFEEGNLTEDFEMALRVHSKNYKIKYILDSTAYTEVPKKFKGLARQRIRWYYGTLYNLKKYRNLLSLNYGNLGAFFMPVAMLFPVIFVFLFFFISYNLISEIYSRIHFLSLINFRPTFTFEKILFLYFITDPITLLFILLFFISLFLFYFARKHTKEKSKITVFNYLIYLIVYPFLTFYFWTISFFRFLIQKEPKW